MPFACDRPGRAGTVTAVSADNTFTARFATALAGSHPDVETVGELYESLAGRLGPGGAFGLAVHQVDDRAWPGGQVVEISMIKVDEALRGQGTATAVLSELCAAADWHAWVLVLRRVSYMGADIGRLGQLYSRHGFVELPEGLVRSKLADMGRLPAAE